MVVDEIRSRIIDLLQNDLFETDNNEIEVIQKLIQNKDVLENDVGITVDEIDDKIEDLKAPIISKVEDLKSELENLKEEIEFDLEDTNICKGQQRNQFNLYIDNLDKALGYIEGDEVENLIIGLDSLKDLFEDDWGIKCYIERQPKSRKLSPKEAMKINLVISKLRAGYDLTGFSASEILQLAKKIADKNENLTDKEKRVFKN